MMAEGEREEAATTSEEAGSTKGSSPGRPRAAPGEHYAPPGNHDGLNLLRGGFYYENYWRMRVSPRVASEVSPYNRGVS